jgi:hypothetical protein
MRGQEGGSLGLGVLSCQYDFLIAVVRLLKGFIDLNTISSNTIYFIQMNLDKRSIQSFYLSTRNIHPSIHPFLMAHSSVLGRLACLI